MKKLVSAAMPVKNKSAYVTVLYEDDVPVEIYVDSPEEKTSVGDIYVGHIERILDSAGGAFVRFRNDERGFLPMNRTKDALFVNPKKDRIPKAEDELLVQVDAESFANKQAVLKTKLRLPGNEKLLDEIKEKGIHRPAGTCLYKAPAPWRFLIDKYKKESFSRIVTDIEKVHDELEDAAAFYDDRMLALYKLYDLQTLLDRSIQKRVWLSSGGQIVIEQTEAFVSIDVNSSKSVRGRSSDEIFLSVNKEAAKEAALQIRRRQLSGTILIDFISMKSKEAEKELIGYMKELAEQDPVYTSVIDITALGIMELTRHKVRKSLHRQIEEL